MRSTQQFLNSIVPAFRGLALGLALVLALLAGAAQAQGNYIMSPPPNVRPPGLKNVGIQQNLNQQIPPDLIFTDDQGRQVKLGA